MNLDYILDRATHGWKMFPIAPGAKTPLLRGDWKEHSTDDPEKLKAWGVKYATCNWGLDCGKSGLLVLDVDGAEGEATLSGLEFEHGQRDTLVHATPNGGRHLIYRGSGRTRTRIDTGLDTRGIGGYIVLPGGRLDGVSVEYGVAAGREPAEAPAWLCAATVRKSELCVDVPDVELDSADAINNSRQYLAVTAKPAVEGNGGNAQTYKTVCVARDLGLSEDTALSLTLEHYNQRCVPPWDEGELARIVANAYRYAQSSAPGKQSVEARTESAAAAFADLVPVQPKNVEWYASHPASDREWIVQDWVPKGSVCLVTGRGGTGKSGIGLQLVLGCRTGVWLGMPCQKMPSVYLGCEDSDAELHRRLKGLFTLPEYVDLGDTPTCRFLSRLGEENLVGRANEASGMVVPGPLYHYLVDYYTDQPKGPSLLVLDTAIDVFNGPEGNRAMTNAFCKEILGSLAKRFDLTILLIGHPPKSEGENHGTEYSGSTAWEAAVRSRIYLRFYDPLRPDDHRVMRCSKSNYAASGGEEVLRRQACGGFVRVDKSEIVHVGDEVVYEAIAQAHAAGEPLNVNKRAGLSRCIYNIGLVDASEKELSKEAIDASISRLIKTHRIDDRHGKARGNGLVPAGSEE